MKVIIAGGRDFKDFNLLCIKCCNILKNEKSIEIVSGGQVTTDNNTGEKYGADYLGELFADYRKFNVKLFPADWDTHGKFAGIKRNREMAEYADALICFWDGKSRGSKNMIEEAEKRGLKVRVIKY